jgi:hypothetical protein
VVRGLAGLRCGDLDGVEHAADGLVGAGQGQHVGDALCPERRVRLVVDGLLDTPLGGRELIAPLHPLVMHAQRWPAPEVTATDRP